MFRMQVKTTNEAFADDPNGELARLLRLAARLVEEGHSESALLDINGNRVGEFSIGRR